MYSLMSKGVIQYWLKNWAGTAFYHLLLPGLMGLAMASCAANEPAELIGPEFLGRTFTATLCGALENLPTGFLLFRIYQALGNKEKHLSLNMPGDRAPALFVAMHRFYGGAQQL
jgi:hypothetical protein